MKKVSQFLTNEAIHKKTPQEITALLYEACYTNVEQAIVEINNKNYLEANRLLQKASDILHRLGGGLNYEAGIIADQLEQLYNYMADKVIEANYDKTIAPLKEVLHILAEIMTSWNTAMKKNNDAQPKAVKQKANAYEKTAIYE